MRGSSRYDEAAFQRRLWTPALLGSATVLLWYDASDRSTLSSSGGLLTSLRDKSGNGKTATPFGSGPPIDHAAANHTDNLVLTFAANEELDFTSTATAAGWMAFFVHRPVTIDLAIQYIMANGSMGLAVGGTSFPNFLAFDGTNIRQASGTGGLGSYLLQTYSPDHLYLNGTEPSYASSNTVGAMTLSAIGNRPGFSFFYKGAFGEGIVINSTSDVVRQNIEGYLAWKWGLQTSLLASHPWVSGPPLIG